MYTSTSLALASVETFVHLEPILQPDDLVSIRCVLPDDVKTERVSVESLARGWHRAKDESLRFTGDNWIRAGKTVALYVPSAAIREEWNVLVNPDHPEFPRIKIFDSKPFEFDLRMFRR